MGKQVKGGRQWEDISRGRVGQWAARTGHTKACLALLSLPGPSLSSMLFRNDRLADKILAGPGGPGELGVQGLSAPVSKWWPRLMQTHRCHVPEPSLRAPTLPPVTLTKRNAGEGVGRDFREASE